MWFFAEQPIILAGMNVAAGPSLAAAVCNAGGLGVVGGVGYTPELLQEMISHSNQGIVQLAVNKQNSLGWAPLLAG